VRSDAYPVLLDDRQVLHNRFVPNYPREVVQRQRYEQVHVYCNPGAPQSPVSTVIHHQRVGDMTDFKLTDFKSSPECVLAGMRLNGVQRVSRALLCGIYLQRCFSDNSYIDRDLFFFFNGSRKVFITYWYDPQIMGGGGG